jgi:hypothetical protein
MLTFLEVERCMVFCSYCILSVNVKLFSNKNPLRYEFSIKKVINTNVWTHSMSAYVRRE